jgi:hypothetical protein
MPIIEPPPTTFEDQQVYFQGTVGDSRFQKFKISSDFQRGTPGMAEYFVSNP